MQPLLRLLLGCCLFICMQAAPLNDDPDFSKYAVMGKEKWPRPSSTKLVEAIYFENAESNSRKMALRHKFLAVSRRRTEELKRLLKESDPSMPVVVMIVNWGQIHLFFNWMCGLKAEGMDHVLSHSLVFTADRKAYAAIRKLIPTYLVMPTELPGLNSNAAKVFGDATFGAMMMLKLGAVYAVVNELKRDLLFQDVDVIWNHNPIPLFYETVYKDADCLFSYDGNPRQPPFYTNAGFFFIRSTPKGQKLSEDWLFYFAKKSANWVQGIMNRVLMHHYLVWDLAMEVLPTSVVPQPADRRLRLGGDLGNQLDGVSPIVVHAAWTHNHWDKMKKLNAVGKWWFNDKCSLYAAVKDQFDDELRGCMEEIKCDGWRDEQKN